MANLDSDGDRAIEHPAHGYTVDVGTLDAKADDAAGKHIHDQHHPVATQQDRFATKQVDAPQSFGRMLMTFEGWQFRMGIIDPSDEM